ncbi:MAG TPA: PQQ-binding-like beta-propeller repeat protein, partial [Longimicrobium sp.]
MPFYTRRLQTLLVLLASAAGPAACEAVNSPGDGEPAPLKLRTEWYTPQAGNARPMPAAAGSMVYTATGNGEVIARDLATGAPRWTARVGQTRLEGSNLLVRSGVVVAPVVYHTVGLDAATGRELWRFAAPVDSVGGGPANPGTVAKVRIDADDRTVYVSAWGPSVSALELGTGRPRWQWTPEAGTPFRFGAEGVALDGGELFFVADHALDPRGARCEMWVVALEAQTGRQ